MALTTVTMSASEFGQLIGAPETKVLRWLHEEAPIPSWVRGYCAALTVPQARSLALAAGPAASGESKPG